MNEIVERIRDYIKEESEEYYESDMNYNNCDPTTHMKCFSYVEDIEKEILRLLNEVKK